MAGKEAGHSFLMPAPLFLLRAMRQNCAQKEMGRQALGRALPANGAARMPGAFFLPCLLPGPERANCLRNPCLAWPHFGRNGENSLRRPFWRREWRRPIQRHKAAPFKAWHQNALNKGSRRWALPGCAFAAPMQRAMRALCFVSAASALLGGAAFFPLHCAGACAQSKGLR
jgi:hypothetical protein